jgi:hypothetical protein
MGMATAGIAFDSSSIVLVGKDGSFDLDTLYEVGRLQVPRVFA